MFVRALSKVGDSVMVGLSPQSGAYVLSEGYDELFE